MRRLLILCWMLCALSAEAATVIITNWSQFPTAVPGSGDVILMQKGGINYYFTPNQLAVHLSTNESFITGSDATNKVANLLGQATNVTMWGGTTNQGNMHMVGHTAPSASNTYDIGSHLLPMRTNWAQVTMVKDRVSIGSTNNSTTLYVYTPPGENPPKFERRYPGGTGLGAGIRLLYIPSDGVLATNDGLGLIFQGLDTSGAIRTYSSVEGIQANVIAGNTEGHLTFWLEHKGVDHAQYLRMTASDDGGVFAGNLFGNNNKDLGLGANTNEYVRITQTGRMGITTIKPTAVLTVSNTTAATHSFQLFSSNNPTPVVTVSSNGNVAIGTTNVTAQLYVLTPDGKNPALFERQFPGGLGVGAGIRMLFRPSSGSVANGDGIGLIFQGLDSAGSIRTYAAVDSTQTEVTAGNTDGALSYFLEHAGVTASEYLRMTASDVGGVFAGNLLGTQNKDLGLGANTNEYVRITQTGRMGITTIKPTAVLTASNTTAATHTFQLWNSNNPTPVVTVTSNGNVSIGTTNVAYQLHVLSADGKNPPLFERQFAAGGGVGAGLQLLYRPSSGTIANNDGIGLIFQGVDSSGAIRSYSAIDMLQTEVTAGNTEGHLTFWLEHEGANNSLYMRMTASDDGGVLSGNLLGNTGKDLGLGANLLEHVRITQAGRVGIGTIKPTSIFTISNTTSGTHSLQIFSSNNPTPLVTVTSNHNIGINIAVPMPESRLEVSGLTMLRNTDNPLSIRPIVNTLPAYITFNNSANTAYLGIEGASGGGIITGDSAYSLAMSAGVGKKFHLGYNGGSGVALTIDAAALVGIGTLAPASRLDVIGQVRAASVMVSNVTASQVAAIHSDKTLTNAVTTTAALDNFFIGGISSASTNTAAFTITTNNFALDIYYTNMAQRSWVSASIGMTNVLLTEKAWVGLYLDQDGDGTWERTGINVRLQGISALAGVEQLNAFLQPSARFIFTNLGTVANAAIEANSSQWVRQ